MYIDIGYDYVHLILPVPNVEALTLNKISEYFCNIKLSRRMNSITLSRGNGRVRW
jgi:hypothetical protein